jgi:uncharacterized protein YbcV (DUF1398 family)
MATQFTLEDIGRAHRGVTKETVREYLQNLHGLGVVSYATHISDGSSDYFDSNGNKLSSIAVHEHYEISGESSRESARQAIEAHGRGETDYFAFSRQLAAAGVCTWVMDPVSLTCTYYSKSGEKLLQDDV